MKISEKFRNDMNWLHTWAGICLSTVLFIVFWMGTLSVFDHELDQWMQPETRITANEISLSPDDILEKIRSERPDGVIEELLFYLPRHRKPYYEVYVGFENQDSYSERLHPETGELLGPNLSNASSGFFYPMHYRLMIRGNLGYWLVAFATIFMMTLLATGVVIHRKIFKDFFTFRPKKSIGRSSLDLHNVTGTVFLPFHFIICLSGFAIFAGFYASLPFAVLRDVLPENRAVEFIYSADEYGYYRRPAAGEPAEMLPLTPMIEQAQAIWSERHEQPTEADRIDIYNFGDRDAVVEVRRHFPSNRVEARRDSVNFSGSNGEVLHDWQAVPVRQVRHWLEGFHQAQFKHWPLVWLYFIAGLSGCVLIGTGYLFWLSSRKRKAHDGQPWNIRLVEAMGASSTTGVIVATLSYLLVNRIFHQQEEVFGLLRASFEIRSFFVIWAMTFLLALMRREKVWADQSWMIAVLSVAALLMNWISTGDHLLASAGSGLWSIFFVDIFLLVSAGLAVFAALRLRSHAGDSRMIEKQQAVTT